MKEYTYEWDASSYEDEDKPILKITKSSFGSFQWCPKRYEFQYPMHMPIDTTDVMIKGTVVHNSRENFFDIFDIKKAENLSHLELQDYCMSLYPIDDYSDMYHIMGVNDADRFMEAKANNAIENYLPVVNEIKLDAEIVIDKNTHPKYPLRRNYRVHLQGIIDRMFLEDGGYIPMELKTGPWKDWKTTMMRKEMAFYQLLIENCPEETLIENGLDPEINITHWGWYYPASNLTYVEEIKKTSMKAVLKGMAQLLSAYEDELFPAKFYAKTCVHCSFYDICDVAQSDGWL